MSTNILDHNNICRVITRGVHWFLYNIPCVYICNNFNVSYKTSTNSQ